MSEIVSLSLCQLVKELKEKKISVSEAVAVCADRIEKWEPHIQALLALNLEEARAQAAKMDAEGPDPSKPLWGAPITLKDALSTKNLRTTAASRILENFIPFYDAHVVKKLREAGAIILAKANMDEFAMGSATENSAFQKTRNPWNTEKVPGGSSGGSAASVVAGECFASLGSDTGGSIRQPASFCGCVGIKPTYGRVSRFGLFAFASSLDQIGPLARSTEDCALMLQTVAGFDPRDNTSVDRQVDNYLPENSADASLKGKKIGVPSRILEAGLSGDVKEGCDKALANLLSLGAEIIEIDLPSPDIASAVYYIVAMAEASSNLARYDGIRYGRRAAGVSNLDELYIKSRSEGFGQEVKRRVMLGSYILSSGFYDAYYRKAAEMRRVITDQYSRALRDCDAIGMPVAPTTAWNIGTHLDNPLQAYLMDAFTLPVNLAGLPAMSIPIGLGSESGMPVGFQLIGDYFAEKKLIFIANALEKSLPRQRMPNLPI